MIESKIIHICDDEKFINAAITQFESCFPNKNTFYVFKENLADSFIHVEAHSFVNTTSKNELSKLSKNVSENALVILHSLSPNFYDFVVNLPKKNKIVWLCFGFEVYNDSYYFKNKVLLDRVTLTQFPNKTVLLKNKYKEHLRSYYRFFKKSLPLSRIEFKKKVIQRINYLGTSYDEEFKKVNYLINHRKKFFSLWAFPLELIVDVNKEIHYPKKNMQIGNSGFKTGNHLDVFEKIKNYSLVANKVIVPLNYGNTDYIDYIDVAGKKYFTNKFFPLLDFMPLQEYNVILEDIGVAILNNKRQQAVGNTIALLWMGAKVFLSNKNTFYHYLKRIGILIYSYEKELSEKSCNEFLSLEEIQYNRTILFQHLSRKKLALELKEQINKINE